MNNMHTDNQGDDNQTEDIEALLQGLVADGAVWSVVGSAAPAPSLFE